MGFVVLKVNKEKETPLPGLEPGWLRRQASVTTTWSRPVVVIISVRLKINIVSWIKFIPNFKPTSPRFINCLIHTSIARLIIGLLMCGCQ